MSVSTGRYGHPIHHNRIPTTHLIRRRRAAPPRVENRASPASVPPARPQGPRFCAPGLERGLSASLHRRGTDRPPHDQSFPTPELSSPREHRRAIAR
ncbi:vegetative cell wall protein gp1-like [Iris pallida]|uniref:Vegetative cell wall protein gp1-like n=1 Tax=Iris pallida TaxID=29817 RepID=A0AAX6FRN1_IRIPA|nr:vegetative cell wall protein gp1-like [Iris pallida]